MFAECRLTICLIENGDTRPQLDEDTTGPATEGYFGVFFQKLAMSEVPWGRGDEMLSHGDWTNFSDVPEWERRATAIEAAEPQIVQAIRDWLAG